MIKKLRRTFVLLLVITVIVVLMPANILVVNAASTPAAKSLPALTGDQRADTVNIAKSQVGYVEGSGNLNAYGQELGNNGQEWCAYFVVWCLKKAGVVERPTSGSTTANVTWFQKKGLWHNKQAMAWNYNGNSCNGVVDSAYVPQAGDFVAIENNGSASDGPDHTCMVVKVDSSWVYTVEGNISNAVVERKYSRTNWKLDGRESSSVAISGFGSINYKTPYYNPEGMVDKAVGGEGTISIKGWAFDRDNLNTSLEIHVYYGGPAGSGAPAVSIMANKMRTDVNEVYGAGDYHGFESTFSVPNRGSVSVYVYAINIGSGDNVLIGSKTVEVSEVTPAAKEIPKLTGDQRKDVANIAKSQIGYAEGKGNLNIYGKELGQNGVAWGAYFVLWCLDKAGVEDRPTSASTTADVTWFQQEGLWHNKQSTAWSYNGNSCNGVVDTAYVPQIGDFVAIESNGSASDGPDSAGLVVEIDSSWIYTVEGNVTDAVVERKYSRTNLRLNGTNSSAYINGFGSINYKSPAKPVTSITLSKTSLSLKVGATETLTATVLPSDASNKAVTWKSSNTAVATVSTSGKVTAVASGTATITATAQDGSGKSGSCSVTVTQPVLGVTLNKTSVNLQSGGSINLIATVSPSNASNKAVTWTSSNSSVATVSSSGKVTAKVAGTATIKVTTSDGGYTASCVVTVTQPVTGITLNRTSLSLETGESATLTATVSPSNATDKTVNWKSSNTAVAKVSTSGKVTAVGAGTAIITATANDGSGKSASCSVTVSNPMSQQEQQIRAFVSRMYTVALGRAAETDGVDFYTARLLAGDSNGACIAESFLTSPEFKGKGYNNAQYVKVLYQTFFDREPATDEINYWVGMMSAGKTREFVLAGFVNSAEFDTLCTSYGISRGFMRENGKPVNPGIGRFVERFYTVALERAGEKEGIEYWTLQIADGKCTPKAAAKSFFLSAEYVSKNTSDTKYITTLYRTFMGREPEAGGVGYWQGVLDGGATREQILEGFADSAEFKGIMAGFGL